MKNSLYSNFKRYFPNIANDVRSHVVSSPDELIVVLKNGDKMFYDDMFKTIRQLPVCANTMSEEACRREFGIRLRSIMHRKGITQTELSKATGINPISISNYINGKTSPSFYYADKIARALDCTLEYFRYLE